MAARKRAKGSPQRNYSVKANLEVRKFGKVGSSLTLIIRSQGGKLGELEVGQGSVRWAGKGRHTPKRINWTRFAKHMDEIAASAANAVISARVAHLDTQALRPAE